MPKPLTHGDVSVMPTIGKWVWKDESQTLEFISHNPADKHERRRGRRENKAAVYFPEVRGRSSPMQMGKAMFGMGRGRILSRGIPGLRPVSGKHTHVTLQDIKLVACDMTGEDNFSETFEGLYDTGQFDHFLLCLLNYFHSYFEKKAHEEKPNPMNIEPSKREKEYHAELCKKIEIAQKILGQAYCVLLLGLGIKDQHHMGCGRSRVSNTYKDRSMYETLYTFCTYIVWVAFRRSKDYESVKKELNRILRSQTFNPAIRIKNAPEPSKKGARVDEGEESASKQKKEEPQLTPAEYRRQQGRRPPIKSIINQRSPALVSILPSPKEEARWLFKSQGKDAMAELSSTNRGDISQEDKSQYAHMYTDTGKLKVGIIGEPLSLFNPLTLTPNGPEVEGEANEDENKDGSVAVKTTASQERKLSREATGVSQVTQDGLPDEQ